MNTYQLILSHITAVLFCFSLYHLGKVFIVHKKLNNYFYFSIATFSGCLYVFLGLLLSFQTQDPYPLYLYRARTFFLMLSFSAWIFIIYEINFQIPSRIPRFFMLFTGIISLTIPSPYFFSGPVIHQQHTLFSIVCDYRFAPPGPILTFYGLATLLFSGFTLFKLLTTAAFGAHGLFSRMALLCTFLGGIHDYNVQAGHIHNIFIGEFLCTLFLFTIFAVLLFDEHDQQISLAALNRDLALSQDTLEAEVQARTKDLAQANEKLQNEIKEKQIITLDLQKSRQLLEKRVQEKTTELQNTYDQLLHAEKLSAIGKLAATIAHEFGGPIVAIRLFIINLLMQSELTKEEHAMAAMAVEECDRITGLISNLQDFNRPTSGSIEAVNIHEVIDSMVLLSNKNFSQNHITIIKNYSPILPSVAGIQDQLKQVILNLFNNSTHAIGCSGGKITIATQTVGNMVQVTISDTGKGIKREHQDIIFQPFFSTKPEVEGTGLGLSVIYGIIKRHHGTIDVASREGWGTIMTIRLPIFIAEGDITLSLKEDE
jgi:signal transduction histidine kinase